jgi:transposase-like protein
MRNVAKRSNGLEEGRQLELRDVIRRDLREFVITAGALALESLLEEERTAICGPMHARQKDREFVRGGHSPGRLVLGGRRVTVDRPRVRRNDGHEEHLPSWKEFSDIDPLTQRAVEQMLVGVSTRRYERSLEPIGAAMNESGTSKSAVSRRFVEATQKQMNAWIQRDHSGLDLVVVMIDGLHIDEHVILVALGIDIEGRKHVLGLRIGATENATSCTELLVDLRERGVRTNTTKLFVLDGAKALRKAVLDVFGKNALLQRCQLHKTRNVIEQLPESMRDSIAAAMRQAYMSRDPKRARTLLMNLARRLREKHPDAAASLEEGLDETLTILRFQLSERLTRALSNTNMIENLIGLCRNTTQRVKRWRNGEMIKRWLVASIIDASKRFRRVWSFPDIKKLARLLRANDEPTRSLDAKGKAA